MSAMTTERKNRRIARLAATIDAERAALATAEQRARLASARLGLLEAELELVKQWPTHDIVPPGDLP
jgi:hypothetical protein